MDASFNPATRDLQSLPKLEVSTSSAVVFKVTAAIELEKSVPLIVMLLSVAT